MSRRVLAREHLTRAHLALVAREELSVLLLSSNSNCSEKGLGTEVEASLREP
jgi:hypothetical protein